jgi:hypothetical protein
MAAQDPTVSTETNGAALIATSIVFLVLSWLSVFLRTYVRAIMLKGFQMDDWLMLVAQVRTPYETVGPLSRPMLNHYRLYLPSLALLFW